MKLRVDQLTDLIALGLAPEVLQKVIEIAERPSVDAIRMRTRRAQDPHNHRTCSEHDLPPHPPINNTTSSSVSKETSEEHPPQGFPTSNDLQEAVDDWNDLADMKGLPKVRLLTPERRKSLTARLKELGSNDAWVDVLVKLRDSDFCCGESGWQATFDFVIRKSSIVKILEGNYDNAQKQKQANGHNGTDVFRSSSGNLY